MQAGTPINFRIYLFIYFVELRLEPRTLLVLGKHSTIDLHPDPFN